MPDLNIYFVENDEDQDVVQLTEVEQTAALDEFKQYFSAKEVSCESEADILLCKIPESFSSIYKCNASVRTKIKTTSANQNRRTIEDATINLMLKIGLKDCNVLDLNNNNRTKYSIDLERLAERMNAQTTERAKQEIDRAAANIRLTIVAVAVGAGLVVGVGAGVGSGLLLAETSLAQTHFSGTYGIIIGALCAIIVGTIVAVILYQMTKNMAPSTNI